MTIKASGSLSIEEIVTEFGGDDPDALDEYYRGAGLVTDNNTAVPTSGTMSMNAFYNAQLIYTKYIISSTNNIVLSSYFTQAEWTSIAPKQIIINAGITIGSINPTVIACRTGTTVNGQALVGTLELIINGYIYGAGGIPQSTTVGGNGGSAVQAEIPLIITNNNRMYGAGGGGGGGGETGQSYETRLDPNNFSFVGPWEAGIFNGSTYYVRLDYTPAAVWTRIRVIYGGVTRFDSNWGGLYSVTFNRYNRLWYGNDGYHYVSDNATYGFAYATYAIFGLRRALPSLSSRSARKIGGNGIGANQARTNGTQGTADTYGIISGTGGNGGNWGESGTTGTTGAIGRGQIVQASFWGDNKNPPYGTDGTTGFAGGSSGNYIIGNSNVTWNVAGDRLGGVA